MAEIVIKCKFAACRILYNIWREKLLFKLRSISSYSIITENSNSSFFLRDWFTSLTHQETPLRSTRGASSFSYVSVRFFLSFFLFTTVTLLNVARDHCLMQVHGCSLFGTLISRLLMPLIQGDWYYALCIWVVSNWFWLIPSIIKNAIS